MMIKQTHTLYPSTPPMFFLSGLDYHTSVGQSRKTEALLWKGRGFWSPGLWFRHVLQPLNSTCIFNLNFFLILNRPILEQPIMKESIAESVQLTGPRIPVHIKLWLKKPIGEGLQTRPSLGYLIAQFLLQLRACSSFTASLLVVGSLLWGNSHHSNYFCSGAAERVVSV